MAERRPLRARSLDATDFTPSLEALVEALSEVRTAAFIDDEGEAVDLASRDEEFEARIAGAVLSLPLHRVRGLTRKLHAGTLRGICIVGRERCAITRRVADGLDLVMVLDGGEVREVTLHGLVDTAAEIAAVAGLDDDVTGFAVEASAVAEGAGRPLAVWERGVRRAVLEVLGVLVENGVTHVLVRTDGAREVLLRHDGETGHWRRG